MTRTWRASLWKGEKPRERRRSREGEGGGGTTGGGDAAKLGAGGDGEGGGAVLGSGPGAVMGAVLGGGGIGDGGTRAAPVGSVSMSMAAMRWASACIASPERWWASARRSSVL